MQSPHSQLISNWWNGLKTTIVVISMQRVDGYRIFISISETYIEWHYIIFVFLFFQDDPSTVIPTKPTPASIDDDDETDVSALYFPYTSDHVYTIQYCEEPPWPRGRVLGFRLPGLEFQILCLEGISPSSGDS